MDEESESESDISQESSEKEASFISANNEKSPIIGDSPGAAGADSPAAKDEFMKPEPVLKQSLSQQPPENDEFQMPAPKFISP